MKKAFRIPAEDMKLLVSGMGGAIATDRILVDGRPVGYMYRTPPSNPVDSGWAFLAGDESPEYLDVVENSGVYDLNTIANYDPEIIPFLDAPVGSAYLRTPSGLVMDTNGAPEEYL